MKPALLLVDVQRDYLATPALQPTEDVLIHKAAGLLEACRSRDLPVIHIWTTLYRNKDQRLPHWKKNKHWLCVAGTEGHETPRKLSPHKGEIIIHKTGFNGFASGELDAALKRLQCDTVILAGLHLHTCVRTIAAESLERHLNVLIPDDAVATNDPIFTAATRRWLAARCVQFISANEMLSRLDGKTPGKLIHRSPRALDEVLFEVPVAGAKEIHKATSAAQKAWFKWRLTTPASRQQLLSKVADQLDAAASELAPQMAVDIGKPISHGLEEVRRAAANVRDVIRRAAAFELETHEAAGIVRHQPWGVVGIISPFNNPVAIPVGKIAPALVYGNTVAWKPAPAATRISQEVLRIFQAVGVPRDAIVFLTGDYTTAQSLAADENIRAVTLTGSAAAGHAIQEICARRIVPVQAELSGNNAAIVWDDTDLASAAKQIVWGAFGFAGQRCTANRRVIVCKAHSQKFLRELKVAAEKLAWGDPLESATDIGPVIYPGKRDELAIQISNAKAAGHRVEFLFEKRANQSWVQHGAYAQPVIVCCDEPDDPLVQEETMSPLLVVQRAETFEHALELCNGVRHGLVAALFSDSTVLQKKFLLGVQAGILKINSATAGVDVSLPFGGWKESGLGAPEHGEGDRLFYTHMQAVYGLKVLSRATR